MTVYFVQAEHGGPVKIGHAVDVEKRLRGIQTGNPHKLVVRRTMWGGQETEQQLHWRFRDQRLEGEWFECEGLLAEIVDGAEFDWWEDIIPKRKPPRCYFCGGDMDLETEGNYAHARCEVEDARRVREAARAA